MQEQNNGYNNNFENNNDFGNTKETQSKNEQSYFYDGNQHSSYYTPPYYTPNFSSGNDGGSTPPPKKNNTSKIAIAIVSIICVTVVVVIFASLLSVVISKIGASDSSSVNMDKEELTVVKNSPKIEVVQNTDVDYVPKTIPEVVQSIGNSVVEISTSSVVNDSFFHQYVTSGAGSGVIITQSNDAGYIITNNHVVEGAKEITVRLTSGEEYSAQILGSDANTDLAVLRIAKTSGENFTAAPIGDSTKLSVGQEVIAIGNPLGSLGGTVTDGIISALDRTVVIDGISMVLLQHNAAINPGNSGGGLFDSMGNLIGIVNAKTSDTGIEGLGFAIPINIAYEFFNRVMITEPALGIKVTYGSSNRVLGVYVTDITSENSEFRMYDRIVSVNGQSVSTAADYYAAIGALKIGDTVNISVIREGRQLNIMLTLQQ